MKTGNLNHLSQNHQVSVYEVDNFNKIRLDSLFNYLQQAASNSAETLGWGYNDMIKDNLAWILSRIMLNMKVYKGIGETIEVDTWPKGIDGIFALRDFRLHDANKNIIGLASSAWLLVDSNTMRPVKSGEFIRRVSKISLDSDFAIKETPGKISVPESIKFIYEREIKYSDIDVNHHVNNAKYVQFIQDCFELNDFSDKDISSIRVNFLSALKYGDKVKISIGIFDDERKSVYVEGITDNGVKVFQSLVNWK